MAQERSRLCDQFICSQAEQKAAQAAEEEVNAGRVDSAADRFSEGDTQRNAAELPKLSRACRQVCLRYVCVVCALYARVDTRRF